MTQSKTALSAGTLLIILRGRSTRRSFMDLSLAPVGVPLQCDGVRETDSKPCNEYQMEIWKMNILSL